MSNTFSMCKKLFLAATIGSVFSSQVLAETPKGQCPNYWKIYGLFMGSAMICNFPENSAIRKTMNALRASCDVNYKNMSEQYVGDGIKQLHRDFVTKGHAKACAEMYEFMDRVGGSN